MLIIWREKTILNTNIENCPPSPPKKRVEIKSVNCKDNSYKNTNTKQEL